MGHQACRLTAAGALQKAQVAETTGPGFCVMPGTVDHFVNEKHLFHILIKFPKAFHSIPEPVPSQALVTGRNPPLPEVPAGHCWDTARQGYAPPLLLWEGTPSTLARCLKANFSVYLQR